MRSKLLIPSLAVASLVVAACGSTTKNSSTTGRTPATTAPRTGVPSRTYHVKLTGAAEIPHGAAPGRGRAVIALHGATLQVCWRFAHLKGFTKPTLAHIHLGRMGTSGVIVLPLSTKFVHRGCVSASASLIKRIEKDPHGYYVNIHSTRYTSGAVRSQL